MSLFNWSCIENICQNIWFCICPSLNPTSCILNSKQRDTFVCCQNKEFRSSSCELPSRDAICSSHCETEKHCCFPPTLKFSVQNAASRQGSGDERPSCMTHLFIKRWRLSATDLSEPVIKVEEGWRWGWRTFHRLAQPSAAKLLFIPAEHMMTRLWQKANLQMTK